MDNLSSIARPYAHAAFKVAQEQQALTSWRSFLESAASIASNAEMTKVLANPGVSNERLLKVFEDMLQPEQGSDQSNFLKLIAENKRFEVLPAIRHSFEEQYANLEKLRNVKVTTAIEPQEQFLKQITESLVKRIQSEVTLECKQDPNIIGGAILQIGDRVIDGSVRGKLQRLADSLLS